MDLVKKVDECEYIYIYCRIAERGYAEKETMMAGERWWMAPGMVALTSTETNTVFGIHWPEDQEWIAGPEMNYSLGW